jgi:hypothetical protein
MRLRLLPAAAGLLLALALPMLAAGHEITDVDVDCDGEAIRITGKLFGQDGGATVTVTGPDGYVQSFFADQDDEWTVSLPLGPDGEYIIDWPESGTWGPVAFNVDCAEGAVLPTATPSPTDAPEGAVLPDLGSPAGGADPTLPPTDTAAAAQQAGAPSLASLALFGMAAATTWAVMASLDRRVRRRDRERSH